MQSLLRVMAASVGMVLLGNGVMLSSVSASTFTVAKDGSGQFSSVQEAVNSASQLDEVIILDQGVYEEQVTIDDTKNGLVLRSVNPKDVSRPMIRFQDKQNVGPTSCEAAKDTAQITFFKNGAVRVLGALNIRIEGIVIDGGGVYPYGFPEIWKDGEVDCRWPNQYGNAALMLSGAGDVMVRDCEIRNAYYGIYIYDGNEGGVFANANPGDVLPSVIVPFSSAFRTGNHLVEYSRIHDNSYGFFFESIWDMGSTIRYNLIYENHHPTATLAQEVKTLTSDGSNQPGGAFNFRDMLISPLAIYNNTFWHNLFLFVGNWNNGGNHLIFNNIFSEPFSYWIDEKVFGGQSWQEMTPILGDRINNCVFAAHQQKPVPLYVSIMNDLGQPSEEGGLIGMPFPASANVRWLETVFLSTDTSSSDFLVPDWSNPLVQKFIVDGGWAGAGVKDPDGSVADLGAISKGGGRPVDVVTIKPVSPAIMKDSEMNFSFSLVPRIGGCIDPRIVFFRFVRDLDTISNFGNDAPAIQASQIQQIAVPGAPVKVGTNNYKVPVSKPGIFGFFELVIEGTGSDGQKFTSATGFIPYRKLDYLLKVSLLNTEKTATLEEVAVGEPAVLRISARVGDAEFTEIVDPTSINLLSGYDLRTPEGDVVTSVPGGMKGSVDIDVVFGKVPAGGGFDMVTVAGKWIDGSKVIAFLGSSGPIRILSGSAASCKFLEPPEGLSAVVPKGAPYTVMVQVTDSSGNNISSPVTVRCRSEKPEVGDIINGEVETDETGLAVFSAVVTNGKPGETFPLVATLLSGEAVAHTTLECGEQVGVITSGIRPGKKSEYRYELFDMQGRRIRCGVTGDDFSMVSRQKFTGKAGSTVYLIRLTEIKTGKTTMKRQMRLGR